MRTCLCEMKNEMKAFSPAVPCAWDTWAEGKKICRTEKRFRGAASKWEHVTECRTKTQENLFSRHWSFERKHHSYCFVPLFTPEGGLQHCEACFCRRNYRLVMLPRHISVLPLLMFCEKFVKSDVLATNLILTRQNCFCFTRLCNQNMYSLMPLFR